ncbi:carbonic anhydrase [Mycobacteroides franklinii]|uniref:carbonic anhydrase n=1 Tax=Mycobacteroides franklinii TaxID=948102 RepID=UPI001F3EA27B|nr:carbonic anhydrase [Mycobacteroides franklinii]
MTFTYAAKLQHADTLLLTCSDWPGLPRPIVPDKPAQLFIVRNIGNVVPNDPFEASVDAALDIAVNQLDVQSVIVCGHSGCAAMEALLSESIDSPTGPVGRWLEYARESLFAYHEYHLARVGAAAHGFSEVDQLGAVNVAIQLERLVRDPLLAAAVTANRIRVAGLFHSQKSHRLYDISPQRATKRTTR